MAEVTPLRGQLWWMNFDGPAGRRPVIIVSNNGRNRALDSVLVIPLTTAPRPAMSTVVDMTHQDGPGGRAMCDNIREVPKTRLAAQAGALTPATLRKIEHGLRDALGL